MARSLGRFLLTLCLSMASDLFGHDLTKREDRLVERENAEAQLKTAYHEASRSGASSNEQIEALGPGLFMRPWLWDPGQDLTACFWNGSENLRKAFVDVGQEWLSYLNLRVNFRPNGTTETCVDGSTRDIRISLDSSDQRDLWSDSDLGRATPFGRIGNLKKSPKPKVTVNIPEASILRDDNPDEFRFLILHELGHVWGMLHEHQRGLCDKWYNEEEIAKVNGISVEQVRRIFEKLPNVDPYDFRAEGDYDKYSIMQYNMPATWFKPGAGNPCLRPAIWVLSSGDKEGVARVYGPPKVPPSKAVVNLVVIQDTLRTLALNAEQVASAQEGVARATKESTDRMIAMASLPRKECIRMFVGITCIDKPSDVLVQREIDRYSSNLARAYKDASDARERATALRKLQQAHEIIMQLQ